MRMKTQILLSATVFLSFGLGFISGATVPDSWAKKSASDPYRRLDAFAQVLNVIERNYVEETDRDAMIDGAIKGMLRSLDPHSSFMTAKDRAEFERRTDGKFVGIGVEVGIRNDELRIITAFYGGPAYKAGLRSGDVILSIDGNDVSAMSLDALFEAMRGDPGSQIRLTVRRPEKLAVQSFLIERGVVALDLVQFQLLPDDFGYIALKSFGNGATQKVKDAIERLKSYAPNGLNGIVLDLRKNPGGFLNEGVGVANLFIEKGNIVSTRGRNGVLIKSYDATRSGYAYDIPLAVLIDEGSASASEIVAGALKDHKRAILVGQTSFGKASIQNMFPLNDGSSVKLTIGRYYTPSGNCIQAQGITPDVEVEDLILQKKKRQITREKDLTHALDTNDKNTNANANANAPYETGEPLPTIDDLQLFTAIQQLRARRFYVRDDNP